MQLGDGGPHQHAQQQRHADPSAPPAGPGRPFAPQQQAGGGGRQQVLSPRMPLASSNGNTTPAPQAGALGGKVRRAGRSSAAPRCDCAAGPAAAACAACANQPTPLPPPHPPALPRPPAAPLQAPAPRGGQLQRDVYESLLGSRASQLLVSLAGLLPHLLVQLGSGSATPEALDALARCARLPGARWRPP